MKSLSLTCGIILLVQIAFGHAPFDGSARVIVTADSAEVSLTAGRSLAEKVLPDTNFISQLNTVGHPTPVATTVAANLFELSADGKALTPKSVDIMTDGSELQFRVVCPLPASKSLRVRALYLGSLKAPQVSPLIATDENGNVFGSALLSPGKAIADFPLPENLFAAADKALTKSPSVPGASTLIPAPRFGAFLKLGVAHILTGYDHLLFLCALLLGCRRLKTMLAVITGFTLAHSLTLALAALNLVTLPPRLIESLIATSIIFVALENFRREETSWRRYALTCGFGLVHGFGFANALRETGLAGRGMQIVTPLFAFNLGVEIGQLAVAAAVLGLLFGMQKVQWFSVRGRLAFSAAVIVIATVWLCQRVISA